MSRKFVAVFLNSLNLTFGYDGNYTKILKSMGVSLGNGTDIALSNRYVNPGKLFLNGTFMQLIWTYKQYLSINAGIRFDAFDGQSDDFIQAMMDSAYTALTGTAVAAYNTTTSAGKPRSIMATGPCSRSAGE